MLRKISLLCCETLVTIISTISSNNNSSDFCEILVWMEPKALEAAQLVVLQIGSKPLELLGEQKTSLHRDSWQIMQDLAPKSNSCSRKGHFSCAEPLKRVC